MGDAEDLIESRKRVAVLESELATAKEAGQTKAEVAELRKELREAREEAKQARSQASGGSSGATAPGAGTSTGTTEKKPDDGEWFDDLWPSKKKEVAE